MKTPSEINSELSNQDKFVVHKIESVSVKFDAVSAKSPEEAILRVNEVDLHEVLDILNPRTDSSLKVGSVTLEESKGARYIVDPLDDLGDPYFTHAVFLAEDKLGNIYRLPKSLKTIGEEAVVLLERIARIDSCDNMTSAEIKKTLVSIIQASKDSLSRHSA